MRHPPAGSLCIRSICAFPLALTWAACAAAPSPEPSTPTYAPVYGVEPHEVVTTDRRAQLREREKSEGAVDREGTRREYDALVPLMRRAEQIRGLGFLNRFELRVQDAKTLQRSVMDASERTQTERYLRMLQALGLSGADAQKERDRKEYDVPLEGYYDFYRKRLVLRQDVAYGLVVAADRASRVTWRSVILHELVHVLQDQHFDVAGQLSRRTGFDERQGFMALLEGDATLVGLDYAISTAGVSFESVVNETDLLEQILGGDVTRYGTSALGNSALLNPVIFRYHGGAIFVANLLRRGGWGAVDRLQRGGQLSTHEILSPDHHLEGFTACQAKLPEAALRKARLKVEQRETIGRLFLASYLEQGGAMSDHLAGGWRCDRLGVFQHGEQPGAAWVVGFENPEQASLASDMALLALTRTEPAPKDGARPDFAVVSHGDFMLLLRHVPPAHHAKIEAAFRAAGGW
jgi:hypothetical protein